MRQGANLLIVGLLLIPWPVGLAAEPTGQVHLAEVHPRPDSDGREFIELHNPTAHSVDLAGWQLTDGTNTFTFASWTIPAGGYVVVWGGGNASTLGPVWKGNVWNNGGDTVRLLDDQGITMDEMEYGTADTPAPGEGVSLHFTDGWFEGLPSPGQSPGQTDGTAAATVDDVPPTIEWLEVPGTVRVQSSATVTFRVEDVNGDHVHWQVTADGVEVANGTSREATATATAPDTPGTWNWTVHAVSNDHTVTRSILVDVVAGAFHVLLPDGGVRLDGLVPGATDVQALAPFRVVNSLDQVAIPHVDVSPFQSGTASIPVDGNLVLRVVADDGTTTDTPYEGPLQPLPPLSGGAGMDVWMILREVPTPLPAGTYPSSFTVVE